MDNREKAQSLIKVLEKPFSGKFLVELLEAELNRLDNPESKKWLLQHHPDTEKETKMRKVIVRRLVNKGFDENGKSIWINESIGEADFHCFGFDFEEFDNGPGNYSTAIVEWSDGRVENIEVSRIQFIKEQGGES